MEILITIKVAAAKTVIGMFAKSHLFRDSILWFPYYAVAACENKNLHYTNITKMKKRQYIME